MKIEPNLIPIPLEQTNWDTIIGTRIPENQATRRQVFAQASAPTQDFKEGDLWFDTDDNNTIYRANSDLSWVSVVDGSIAGKITTFAQTGIPTSLAAGDLWVDTDDNNKLYRAAAAGADQITAGEWVAVNDPTATTLIGGSVSYTVTSGGLFSFGDGSDGDGTISGDTTLTTDKYYNNLTISNATLYPAGYRIFVKNTLLITNNGIISRIGANGGNGASGAAGGAGGTAGAALAAGYLAGALAGANGGNTQTAGTNGSNIAANSIGVAGANGGAGGDGSANPGSGAAGGTGGTVTASNVKLIANWHLATLLDIGSTGSTVKFTGSASGGGGGGGGNASGTGGGGGASGSNGGIIAIYAKEIVLDDGCLITANGGNGGNGGAGGDGPGGGGGGGGGAGGTGGEIILVYNSLTQDAGASITADGGNYGTGGAAGSGGTPQPGQNGQTGATGHIRYFQVSL